MNLSDSQFELFSNPAFCEYVRLLVRLHDLIRQGADESSEGDAIREQLDVCGEDLSQYEIDTLKGLSADFYSLSDEISTPRCSASDPPAILKSAVEACRAGDFARALEVLRANAADIDAPRLAFLRGQVLTDAGLHDIAHRFFRLSTELEPENENYSFAALDSLGKADSAKAHTTSKR